MDNRKLVAALMGTFLEEVEEHVSAMNENLLAVEKTGDPVERAARVQALFRAAHSLKGAARAVNIIPLETACHRLESLLADAVSGRIALDGPLIQLLYRAADALQDAGKCLREGRDLAGSSLADLLLQIDVQLARTPVDHGALPERTEAKMPLAGAARVTTTAVQEAAVQTDVATDLVRVSAGKMDSLMNRSGELLVASRSLEARRVHVEDLQRLVAKWMVEWRGVVAAALFSDEREGQQDVAGRIRAIRVVEGERIRKMSRELAGLGAALATDQRVMGLAVRRIDEEAKAIRMLPFVQVFQRLERAVRDLAQAAGKEVEVVMEGGDVEMDRAILEGLRDPLLQVARNALDHGIEIPSIRKAAGKPVCGRITVTAGLRGAFVEITVADDGRGLDLGSIRAQAEQRGMPAPLDDHDLSRLIFMAGFTTKRKITEVSGRGVGLDIARTQLEALHGNIEVFSVAGHGCRFVLEVPQTLTTVRALLMTAGGLPFAVPLSGVRRLLLASPAEFRQVEGRQMLMVDGAAINVAVLADLLGLAPDEQQHAAGRLPLVVLEAGDQVLAVVVEELLEEREILVKNPGPRLSHLKTLLGVTVLPDGGTALILSPGELVRDGSTRKGTLLVDQEPASKRRKRLLVADDSLTTRSLEKSILEGAGFDVVTVQDGMEAMESLKVRGADLLVSDCEMPRMDGFDLTRAVRASKQFNKLPVILLTGLESDASKARGLDAGADAYLLKSGFDQKMLIETIRQLL